LRAANNLKNYTAKGDEAKTQPAPPEARKRYVVGIDPGVKTGFAVWDREGQRFDFVETSSFWNVFFKLSERLLYCPDDTLIVVEVAHYAPVFRERKAKGENVNHAARMAQNVGQVMREAKLLAEGLRRCGYEVVEQKPLGKAKNAADDRAQFERSTGWTKQTSQHARDAARICFQR
jgi:predicted nuclease with RNAse H fold